MNKKQGQKNNNKKPTRTKKYSILKEPKCNESFPPLKNAWKLNRIYIYKSLGDHAYSPLRERYSTHEIKLPSLWIGSVVIGLPPAWIGPMRIWPAGIRPLLSDWACRYQAKTGYPTLPKRSQIARGHRKG